MKTAKSLRLFSSSRAPATQYSRSGDAIALAQRGSSSGSRVRSVDPVEIAERTSPTLLSKVGGMTSTGNR